MLSNLTREFLGCNSFIYAIPLNILLKHAQLFLAVIKGTSDKCLTHSITIVKYHDTLLSGREWNFNFLMTHKFILVANGQGVLYIVPVGRKTMFVLY